MQWKQARAADRPVHPVRLAALLALLAMFGPFAIDAFFPAFRAIGQDLGASPWQMQQTISLYLLAYAVMSLFHGPLSDARGRRIVVLGGVMVFALASVGCALAWSVESLFVFRSLQGLSTGAGLIVGRAIVRDLWDGAEAQRVMSLITLFFGVAPALAPIVGGLVFEAAGWRAVFWLLALYGAGLYLLCRSSLPETHPEPVRHRFAPGPLFAIYARIGSDLRFVLLVLATGFNFGASFVYIASAPAFIETILGLGTLDYSWFFVPMIAGMMSGAALSTRLAGVIAPRTQAVVGYTVMVCASLASIAYNFTVERAEVPWAILPILLNSLGISLTFPVLSIKMLDRYPANRGAASSMQAFLWGLVTSAIAAFLAPALSHSHRALALGAATLVAMGFACWWWFARITPLAPGERPHEVLEEPLG
jgi:DHA1 family bicyclomycin/chloramphenicol resistance-like MFS transporter